MNVKRLPVYILICIGTYLCMYVYLFIFKTHTLSLQYSKSIKNIYIHTYATGCVCVLNSCCINLLIAIFICNAWQQKSYRIEY